MTHIKNNTNDKLCNCRKQPCPLDNKCLNSDIIYKATITTDKTTKQSKNSQDPREIPSYKDT